MSIKINVRKILEAKLQGFSNNNIAATYGTSKHSVQDVVAIAEKKGILPGGTIPNLTDEELYRTFFPEKWANESIYTLPDYEYVHSELNRTGVTLKTLYDEYCLDCKNNNQVHIGYTKYCNEYKKFIKQKGFVSHIEHKAGDRIEVDWSGPTMSYIDQESSKTVKVYLFVADLVSSRLAYVEPCLNMNMDTWIKCHINMFNYYGGVARILVCDNLKTGVVKHPKDGEIILTKEYESLSEHYGFGILPAGVKKPRQKNSTENTVYNVALKIIAKLRDVHFTSFGALKAAVARQLEVINNEPFQKREGSRRLDFEENEKVFLKPLPESAFIQGTWYFHKKCGPNGHICVEKNWYSVPFTIRHLEFDVKTTESEVFIYNGRNLVKRHLKIIFGQYKYCTDVNDLPPGSQFSEWTSERIIKWANQFGTATTTVIKNILSSRTIVEQTFNSALCILNLSKKYEKERIEKACELALQKHASPRYANINAILVSKQDLTIPAKEQCISQKTDYCSRGEDFFKSILGGDSKNVR